MRKILLDNVTLNGANQKSAQVSIDGSDKEVLLLLDYTQGTEHHLEVIIEYRPDASEHHSKWYQLSSMLGSAADFDSGIYTISLNATALWASVLPITVGGVIRIDYTEVAPQGDGTLTASIVSKK